MESIVNDTTDETTEPADANADQPIEQPATEAASDTTDAEESSADDVDETPEDSGDDGVISAEKARKLRSEASNLRHRLREAEGELERLRGEVAERDERLSAAETGRLDAMIYSRAAGKLQNPADAVVFLDRGDLSPDDVDGIDAAIESLLQERHYLRAGTSIPQIDQGVQRERPKGKSFSDVMAEGLGWKDR